MIIDNLLSMAGQFILPLSVLLICVLVYTLQSFKESEIIKRKRSIASTFHHLCPSAIIVSYYTQSKKFSTRLF